MSQKSLRSSQDKSVKSKTSGNQKKELKKKSDVVELPPITSANSKPDDKSLVKDYSDAKLNDIDQTQDIQHKPLLEDHSHIIDGTIDQAKVEDKTQMSSEGATAKHDRNAKIGSGDQVSSDQTQIAPAPSKNISIAPENKSTYHPQMVDRFERSIGTFFGSRNIKHEFSDEDSLDDELDPMAQESPKAGLFDVKGLGNRIGVMKDHDASRMSTEEDDTTAVDGPKSYAKFKNYKSVFEDLTKHKKVDTPNDIVSMLITYDSTHTVAVTKNSDCLYYIKMFHLETYECTFEEKVGGSDESYIKMKDIEQNASGSKFALAYIDDGNFKLRVFGKEQRTQEEIDKTQLNINEKIGINNFTMPISNFPEPFITCTFINDDLLFVNLFYNHSQVHYHFLYNIPKMKHTNLYSKKMDEICTRLNFPYKCFYDTNMNQVYSFYRQGQSFTLPIDQDNHETEITPQFEQIIDKDLGQMFLINNKALVVRSSDKIFFFRREKDEDTEIYSWQLYETLKHKGLIYYIKGNVRIQVTTDEKIYFYMIDQKTFEPTLEAVMFNFMKCNQMMFGSKVRYCITFKTNQKGFEVYRRKYEHNFKSLLYKENFEGSSGLQVTKTNRILVTQIDKVCVINSETYKKMPDECIEVKLFEDKTAREPNQILSMALSDDEDYLALITGKSLIKNQQTPNQLFVYKLNEGKFELIKNQKLKDNPELKGICMQFHFKMCKHGSMCTSLFFAQKNRIIEYDFMADKVSLVYELDPALKYQPNFFVMNDDQNCCIISNTQDSVYIKIKDKEYVDIDVKYRISSMKQIVYDLEFQTFYIMANKYRGKLGLFIIKLEEENPDNYQFLLKIKNKLDIGDADIEVHKCHEKHYKELIVSYKTIYMNTYNVTVIDITNPKQFKTIFRHESFQLWESPIKGFLVDSTKDYVTLNSNGLSILALGNTDKRVHTGNGFQEMVTHSLEQLNYLKVDSKNLIEWDATDQDFKLVYVKQLVEVTIEGDTEQYFDQVYNIKLHKITLRELLLLQSIEKCSTQSQILDLVKEQPTPTIFLKSFFELNGANMTAILSFDSKSIHSIIGEHNDEHFTDEYPVFYRNKIAKKNNPKKFFFRSAIDTAMKNNQVQAVHYMIDYIIRFQNNYTSSFLFNKNFTRLQAKGIGVAELLNSNVFIYKFDYELWPQNHTDADDYIRPYNGSIFDLRNEYANIFHEPRFRKIRDNEDSSKVFKVNYSINLLPQIGIHNEVCPDTKMSELVVPELQMMELFTETEELDVFQTPALKQVIQWKWQSHGQVQQSIGLIVHLIYLLVTILYITDIYQHAEIDRLHIYRILLILGLINPLVYDIVQMIHVGPIAYFSSFIQIIDFVFIYSGLINCIMLFTPKYSKEDLPVILETQVLMILTILCSIPKTFLFLRVFGGLSYIVTMLMNVISDLKVFLLFYGILIFMFSQFLTIMGIGNCMVNTKAISGEDGFREQYGVMKNGKYTGKCNWNPAEDSAGHQPDEPPGKEYMYLGLFLGNIVSTFRMSLGDFDFDAATELLPHMNIIFWVIWFLIVVVTNIIFLNFIIAEASASYENVSERLDDYILKERAQLIHESEDMTFDRLKTKNKFPKYIINRTIDK